MAHTARRDTIHAMLGIGDGSALANLRALRPEATVHTQGSYQALFVGHSATGVTVVERFATALRVAALHQEAAVIDHYAARLRESGEISVAQVTDVRSTVADPRLPVRLRAIIAHADLLVLRPAAATPADIEALRAAGLSAAEIVTVSQLIAFVSYQVRVVVGLSLLRGDSRGAPVAPSGPHGAPTTGFTQAEVGWSPWLPVFAPADATVEQRAVLPGQRINSPYFRLLALDPAVLGERTATDMGIFYTHGGLPRADRELAATVASRVNGCVYCASVHSRRAAELSKRRDDVQRLLDDGITADLDHRWQAITAFAAALTVTPPTATQQHVARLRDLGLQELEVLDVIQSAAFFAWANRLMLTLGEPVLPPTSSAF